MPRLRAEPGSAWLTPACTAINAMNQTKGCSRRRRPRRHCRQVVGSIAASTQPTNRARTHPQPPTHLRHGTAYFRRQTDAGRRASRTVDCLRSLGNLDQPPQTAIYSTSAGKNPPAMPRLITRVHRGHRSGCRWNDSHAQTDEAPHTGQAASEVHENRFRRRTFGDGSFSASGGERGIPAVRRARSAGLALFLTRA